MRANYRLAQFYFVQFSIEDKKMHFFQQIKQHKKKNAL